MSNILYYIPYIVYIILHTIYRIMCTYAIAAPTASAPRSGARSRRPAGSPRPRRSNHIRVIIRVSVPAAQVPPARPHPRPPSESTDSDRLGADCHLAFESSRPPGRCRRRTPAFAVRTGPSRHPSESIPLPSHCPAFQLASRVNIRAVSESSEPAGQTGRLQTGRV